MSRQWPSAGERPPADRLANHHKAGGNPDAHAQFFAPDPRLADLTDHGETAAHGLLRVGLLCFRPAKIGQHAISHVARDEAAEARNCPGHAGLIIADQFAKVFGVQIDDSAVDPARSQNITLMWRRSGTDEGGCWS